MRKLAITEFVSLDGVMQAPGGEPDYKHTGWVFPYHDEGSLAYKGAELDEFEALLLGRKTYEGFAAAWPEREGEFADKMNGMPKYVVSSTLSDPEWNNSTVLEGDAVEAVSKLKEGDGGPIIVHGSATLVHTLHKAGLIDEYRLMVFPIVLGSGFRVFPDDAEETAPLKLVETKAFDSGVVVHHYHPAQS